MKSIAYIPGSDGSGNTSLMTVQSGRAPGATTIAVNTTLGLSTKFYGSMGTPHTFTDPITGETITVISEATAVDFAGHVDAGNIEIDEIAPGYTDNGSEVGDIIVIRPNTEWANNLHNVLAQEHNDDGTLKRPTLGDTHYYTTVGANTWTKPEGLKYVIVEVQGGGGGGGGAQNTGSGTSAPSSGGGGGGYAKKKILAADLAATETVTVGNGGARGYGSGTNGYDGALSRFGSHCTGEGGTGGGSGSASSGIGSYKGGGGGLGIGGDVNIRGGSGDAGTRRGGTITMVGTGGDSVLGFGGAINNTNDGVDGNDGENYGGGGSGGYNYASQTTARYGGNGGQGIVIVHEYF